MTSLYKMVDLKKVVDGLQKKYGITIGHLDSNNVIQVPAISTGIIQLDIALGIGGIPRGYITEIYSAEGVGKTTLCLQIVAQAQREGLEVSYIDMEHRLDINWAMTLGVDVNNIYFTQPESGEDALNIARALARGGVSLIVIDSVPALVPRAELDGETGDQYVGLQPRMIAQSIRQMVHDLKTNNVSVVFVNQVRAKIGGYGSLAMGPQQTQPGGWALKHFASVRIDMKRIKSLKDSKGNPTGHQVIATVRKNSLGTPYRQATLTLKHGVGFDPIEDMIDLGLNLGHVEQSGSWYTLYETKVQGRNSLYDMISGSPDICRKLEDDILGVLLYGKSNNDN